ncbi:hypothetical protein EVAR_87876_1 [Eumeta japonica]|uniref:Uncharacterized protein n=1 Tax=Eumeta variegata TaxID=151549 RepID=A0A4C1WV78_EUMVA|nr:hypothetical protein EVAR_87876_1 [Eumeta japonica]
MFLRVKIRKEDRDRLRFLKQNNCNENSQEHRMTSFIFDAASSACTVIYIKNCDVTEFEHELPEACKAVRLDVRDFLKTFYTIAEAKRVSKEVYEIRRSAVDWDEQVNVDEHKKWLKRVNEIMKLSSINVPRVLPWICSDPRLFKTFVAHRLDESEKHTTVKCLKWVPTKLNVADNATHGPPTDFDEAHWWFRGPDFLRR